MAADVVNIADCGDILLVVGQSDNIVKLRVDSHMMRNASKVFKTMFGPDFEEGQNLSSSNPVVVPLCDDDPDAMEIVCKFIHFKHYDVPTELESKRVFQIAKIIDKYFMHEALKFAVKSWLQVEKAQDFSSLSSMLKATMLLKQPAAYTKVTKALVMGRTEPYTAILDGENPDSLIDTIYSLEQQRSRLRTVFNQAIFDAFNCDEFHNMILCDYTYAQVLRNIILQHGLEPKDVATKSITACLEAIKTRVVPVVTVMDTCNCDNDDGCHDDNDCIHKLSMELLQELKNTVQNIEDFEGLILEND